MIELVIVVAIARNGVIGGDNRLLWHLPGDLQRFRELTWGKPIIMGRKTYASIGRVLPGRETIVVTRDSGFAAPGVQVAHDIAPALALGRVRAQAMGASQVILGGGGEIYAAMIGQADRLHVTEVDLIPNGEARFPAIDPALWQEVARLHPAPGPRDAAGYQFVEYARRV